MRECTEARFLDDVSRHEMTVLGENGLFRHLRFRTDNSICMSFDLITWPGALCIDGDMGTDVLRRLPEMFQFFRTDRRQPRSGQMLYINLGYWAEKVMAADKNGKIEEFDPELAKRRLVEELKELRGVKSREERRDVYDAVVQCLDDGEHEVRRALSDEFPDSWEWRLTDYTYHFVWCCYAIAWGIQQYDAKDSKPAAALVLQP